MTTTTPNTAYIVVAPCLKVRGVEKSDGTFYAGDTLGGWDYYDGVDTAPPEELARLLNLGMITQVA